MDLSRNLLKAFSDISNPKQEKKETYLYATAKVDGGNVSIRIDGSTVDTPVETTAEIKNGERVLVTIDNNKAILVGNMSSPAARVGTVEEVKGIAETAKTNSNKAIENANEAKTQATNFIDYDETGVNGLILADKTNGEFKGFRSQLLSDRYNILNEEGIPETSIGAGWGRIGKESSNNIFIDDDIIAIQNDDKLLASFTANEVKLGIAGSGDPNVKISSTNNTSTIELCYGLASMKSVENEYGYGTTFDFELTSMDRMKIASTNWLNLMTGSESALNVYHSAQLLMNADGTETSHIAMFASDTMSDGPDSSQLLLTSFGLDVSASSEIRMNSQAFMYLESNDLNIKINNTMTFESYGNININTYKNGVVKVNGDRIMKAKLPDGGYWGMVVPTGSDTSFIRTTTSGLIPYAQENTSKIGTASYRFSEGHFKSLYANNVFLPNGKAIMGEDTSGGYKNIGYISSEDYLVLGGGNHCPVGVTVRGENAVNIRVLNTGLKLENVNNNSTYLGYFHPINDNKVALGRTANRWTRLYAANTSISDSDVRLKTDIQPLDKYSELFDKLIPKAFRFKSNPDKVNFGLIAQEVMESMKELGIDIHDLDLVEYDEENDYYGMAYSNIIALLIYEVQKLKEKNNETEIN